MFYFPNSLDLLGCIHFFPVTLGANPRGAAEMCLPRGGRGGRLEFHVRMPSGRGAWRSSKGGDLPGRPGFELEA